MTFRLLFSLALISLLFPPGLAQEPLQPQRLIERYAEEAKQWEDDIARIEQRRASESHRGDEVLFIGGGSLRSWETIAEDLAPYRPVTRGFGGAKLSDVLVHLSRILGNDPDQALVFLVGEHDVSGTTDDKSLEEIERCAEALIRLIRDHDADVPILLVGIPPSPKRTELDGKEQEFNAALSSACDPHKNVHFIATRDAFLDSDGQRTGRWFADDTRHLNATGYDRLGALITAKLDEVLGDPPARLDPWRHHQALLARARPKFTFSEDSDFASWQPKLRAALLDVLGIEKPRKSPLRAVVEPDESTEDFESFRVVFQAESGVDVPCYLLKPKGVRGPLPVMICLQGHKKEHGMLVSVGRVPDRGGRDIALQAVRHGWAALAVEQRCFGERRGDCQRESLDALMLGRTLTGERVFDVMRAIDFIETQSDLDASRIGCMGNSTGGTVTFYAACVDPRIRLSVVSCSYCTYAESWMKIPHCACGYLPGILEVADMGDLGGLVAPRHLIIVAGKNDYLATIAGVRTAFAQTRRIFQAAGYESNASLLVGEGGHRFYPELAWPVIQQALESWNSEN